MANKLEELRVYQDAMAFWNAVNAILDKPAYRRDRKLAEQTSDANDSIPANISEGFEQPTDAAFANYLYHAKGSLGEVVARLREARLKKYITPDELSQRLTQGTELSRSLGAFIRYLDGCRWKDRGRHKSRLRQERQPDSQNDNDPETETR
jgi:four helix bundle protein